HTERAFVALSLYIRYGGGPEDEIVARYRPLLSKRAVRRAEVLGLSLRLAYRISSGNPALLVQSALSDDDGKLTVMLPPNGAAPDEDRISSTIKRLCAVRSLKPGPIRVSVDHGS
ncbi:MAG: hypothetical protein ACPGRZ_12480, partial [Alphaproteobacteria bacterium]